MPTLAAHFPEADGAMPTLAAHFPEAARAMPTRSSRDCLVPTASGKCIAALVGLAPTLTLTVKFRDACG